MVILSRQDAFLQMVMKSAKIHAAMALRASLTTQITTQSAFANTETPGLTATSIHVSVDTNR